MKVVLFCGGHGLRLRDYAETFPKPMVPIGPRPVLWHVMRYYAHFGYKDFILCLGYKADVIKDYFLRYNEALSNDFILSDGGRSVELLRTDIQDWRITFVDTGLHASIGERLLAVQRHVGDDELFLANYGDNLTDAPLDELVEDFRGRDKVAAVPVGRADDTRSTSSKARDDGHVAAIAGRASPTSGSTAGTSSSGRRSSTTSEPGEELVEQPFERLIGRAS